MDDSTAFHETIDDGILQLLAVGAAARGVVYTDPQSGYDSPAL